MTLEINASRKLCISPQTGTEAVDFMRGDPGDGLACLFVCSAPRSLHRNPSVSEGKNLNVVLDSAATEQRWPPWLRWEKNTHHTLFHVPESD